MLNVTDCLIVFPCKSNNNEINKRKVGAFKIRKYSVYTKNNDKLYCLYKKNKLFQ